MRTVLMVLFAGMLIGCAQTYFAFPAGHTKADFDRDNEECFWTLENSKIPCMQRKGYRVVSEAQAKEINTRAQILANTKPYFDVAGFDVESGEIFVGKSDFVPGEMKSSITIEGLSSKVQCTGASQIVTLLSKVTGSIGKAILICRDGRTLSARFVYESSRSGWGVGKDDKGNEFRFLFGDLDLDVTALQRDFKKQIQDKKTKASGRNL